MLLFIDGFDHYGTADLFRKWTSGSGSIVPGEGRSLTQALRSVGPSQTVKGILLGDGATEGIAACGFAFKGVLNPTGTKIFSVFNGGVEQWHAVWEFSGAISVRRGETVLATSAPDLIRIGSYVYLEFAWEIDPAVGSVQVRVNNVDVEATVYTVDTSGNGSTAFDAFALVTEVGAEAFFDDLYICDNEQIGEAAATGLMGDTRILYRRPVLDGFRQEWLVEGGGTQANAVDKNANTALLSPRVVSAEVGQQITNIYEDAPDAGSCYGVQVSILAATDEPGDVHVNPVVRIGAEEALGDFGSLTSDPTFVVRMFGQNPFTEADWEVADLIGAEFGARRGALD